MPSYEWFDIAFKAAGFVVLAAILTVLLVLLKRRSGTVIAHQLDEAGKRFAQAAAHHAQVNAVLALTEQFEGNPELLRNLAGYSRQVVAAALLHRANTLGCDLKAVEDELSEGRQMLASGHSSFTQKVNSNEELVMQLRARLAEVNKAIQEFSRQAQPA